MARETNRPDTPRAMTEALARDEWVDPGTDGARAAVSPTVTLALNTAAKRPAAARNAAAAAAAPEVNADDPSAASLLVKGASRSSAKAATRAKAAAAVVVPDELPNPTARTGTESSLEEGLRVVRLAEEPLNGVGERHFAPPPLQPLVQPDTAEEPAGNPAPTPLAFDNVEARVGRIPERGFTNDNTPNIRGDNARPGATITVFDNGQPVATTTVDPQGHWAVDTPKLADGPHQVTIVETNPAGRPGQPSDPLNFTVDTRAPDRPDLGGANASLTGVVDDVAPITGDVKRDGVTNDTQPTYSGKAEPGSTVTVIVDGKPVGDAPVGADGKWTLTPAPPLADGPHSVAVTATDAAGNTSLPSDPFPFIVDTQAPDAPGKLLATDDVGPKTGTIPNNGITDDNKPTISGGGATEGDTITVYDKNSPTPNTPLGTAVVKPDGTWSIDTPVLADGPHLITTTATDPAGNTSVPTTPPLSFTVDTAAPDIGITLDANVAGDGIVNAAEAAAASLPIKGTVSGSFNPGDIVTLTLNGVKYTGPVAADGSFSINVPGAGLNADADRTIEASVTTQDAAGNSASASDAVGYRLATDPPKATIKLDANFTGDGVVNLAESLLLKVPVSGTVGGDVKVGDVVTVTLNGKDFTTTVKAGNVFSVDVPGADLAADADKTIDAKVVTVDVNGNSAAAATRLVYGVDTVPPAKPTITDVLDDVGALTGSVPKNGATDDTLPQIKGSAEPGASVTVYDGTTPIGTTTADAQGNWALTPLAPLLNGPRSLTAVATDAAENPSAPSDPYPIVVDANGPVAPAITRVDDNTGSVQGPIQKSGVTDDTTPTVVGTAGPNLKINLFDNGALIGTTTSNAAGDWSFTPSNPLATGPHNITATAVSAAGVESAPTGAFPFSIDTTAPALVLTSANDDVGTAQGVITPGGKTDDATPTLKGTGEPGASVTVFDNGQPIGTTVVKPDGSWALTPNTPLADGPHTITATSTDPAGNTSPPTSAIAFTVDTSAVVDPVITRALDDVAPQTGVVGSGGATNDKAPTLEGTARPGDKVELFYKVSGGANVSIGSTVADAAGQWTLTPSTALTERAYDFVAVATSPTGNLSQDSNTYRLLIDSTAPGAPVITNVTDDVGSKQGSVASGGATDDTTPTLVGTGTAGDTIRVLDGTTVLGTATVKADGSWSLTPTTTLADGPHEFKAVEVDAAGNPSAPSNPYSVIIDTQAPAKPVITGVDDDVGSKTGNVAPGDTTDDTRPKITGSAEKGATVDVFDNGKLIGTAIADPVSGVWSLTPSAPLLNGPTTLTAIASDAAGNPSAPSDPYAFIVDANGPVAPAITRIDDDTGALQGPIQKGGSTDDTSPTVVGTAGPNLKINVYDGTTLLGSTTSNAQGDWSFTPAAGQPLAQGSHVISATAVSAAGVESDPTGPFPFVIDTTPPALALVSANDDVGASQGVIAARGITDDATPTLKGTGEPGATVTVLDNGQPIGTTTVKSDGSWALTPTTPLADGPHNITATASDAAGNTTAPTAPLSFTVDTSAVVDPVITRALDDFAPQTGVVANGGATNDRTPTLEGTARAGDRVVVSYKDAAGATLVLGSTTADATGHWTLTPTTPLAERAYEFTAIATGATGNPSNPSNTYGLVIDTTAPNAPVITAVIDDVGAFKGAVPTGAKTDDTTPTIVGTGVAGDTIRVLDGTTVLGTTTVKADGSWSLTPTTTLADGPHEFKAVAIDAAANESLASNAYPVIIDTLAPAKPTITGVEDDVGTVLGNVAIGGTTDDTLPGIKGKAEAGATVTVFDGSKLIGTAVADANGDWSLTPSAPLLNGPRSLTAVATDAAGNPSVPSDPYTFSVDSNGPVAPAITRVDDNVGSLQGPIQKSGTTDDTTPTVVGTAGPNLKINVYDGLTLLGSTTSNAQGDWSFTPANPLATGPHNITATAVSAAGVESAPTGVFPFSIDTTAPALTLDTANDDVGAAQGVITPGGKTDDATPTLRGTGEPGATVKVFDNGQLIGTSIVTAAGTWALTPSTPLVDGPHSITATATDPAGNSSPPTAPIPFTVDTSAVVDPVITRALDDFAPQTGVVASGSATNDKTPTLEGTARAGDKVELFYKGPGGINVSIGITTADASGKWTLTPAALTERSYDFVAVATGPTGNLSKDSNTYSLLIDATAPAAPVITTVTDDVGSKQGPVVGGTTTDDTTPTIVGSGTAGDTIRVLDGSTVLGTTTVKADGTWSLTPTTTLNDGLHNFRAVEVDAAGNDSLPSNTYAVTIDTQAPAKPTITGVTDDVGAVQGNVASGGTTDDALPGIKGKAEAGATVNVFDGARLVGTATADANGDWTLAVTAALASGAHTFTATATDAAGNPSGASDPYGITIDTSLVIVVNPGSATATSEEGLVGGVKDATGTPADTTDATSAAGTLSASGPGGAATTWTLTAPTTILTAGGVAVTWTGSGTQTLIGSAGGVQVATLSINNSGAYTFTLLAPIDHPVKNAEDVLTLNFGVNAGNGTSTGVGTLALTVEDDAPSAVVPQTRDAAVLDTNLLITLDISGSMSTTDGVGGQTRLQSAIQSINALLDKYDAFGDVRVRLVTFSSNASAVGDVWTDIATAKAQLAALAANGGTNYDEALGDTITAFSSAGRLAGGQNVGYFFSDGAPTLGSGNASQLVPPGQSPGTPPTNNSAADVGIQSAEETLWINFLNANQIKAFAIGFGSSAPTTPLDPIAYDGQQGANTNALVVTNFAQLDNVLATTVTNIVTGNLLGGDLISATGGLGGDAPGFVQSLTIEGTTYTYSPAAGGSVTVTGGANRGVFDTATDSITITTAAGGRFIVDLDGGEYRYESPTTVTTAIAETFNYTLTDRDGDTVGSSVTVNVSRVTASVGTAGADTLAGTAAPDFIMGLAGNDNLSGNAGDDKLFGGSGNDTLAGGAGNDALSGGADNDTLIGGDGADRMTGGAGTDALTGGNGVDVFAWSFGDAGTAAARPVDTITDFNVAAVSASGDVLDLRDLLVGELKGAANTTNPNGTVGNLQNFLDFNVTGGNTEIRVSSGGQFAGGTYAAGSEDQRIVLQGVDIRSSLSLAATATDAQIIQELLNRGKLIADGP